MSEQRIIVTGTPVEGFTFIGPFDSFDSAESYADHIGVMGDWWITDLQSPGTPEAVTIDTDGTWGAPTRLATHVHNITGELVTVTGHTNGITIFDSPDEEGEELLSEVFAEQYDPIITVHERAAEFFAQHGHADDSFLNSYNPQRYPWLRAETFGDGSRHISAWADLDAARNSALTRVSSFVLVNTLTGEQVPS